MNYRAAPIALADLSQTLVFKKKETACPAVRSSAAERESLLALPDTQDELIGHYYLWRSSAKIGAGKFRPLRPLQPA